MKKIFLILVVVLFFLAGCTKKPETIQNNEKCPEVVKPQTEPYCDYLPEYNADKSCIISYYKVCAKTNPQPEATTSTKEFTVEGDDKGLYPETINVNKGDKVKLTFKVRTDNVYYGGLDFRSDYFDTGKVLPGSIKTVEFTADKTFNYKSYWPSSNVLKDTGTINVN